MSDYFDIEYQNYPYNISERKHFYGENIHLLSDVVLLTQLAHFCEKKTTQPNTTYLVRCMYEYIIRIVMANEFPCIQNKFSTRMINQTDRAVWKGQVLDIDTPVVTVNIARAGTLPSQTVFETLVSLLSPKNIRQDHLYMNRITDEQGAVTGASIYGSKVGGGIDDTIVIFPDPMGATGSSMSRAINVYKNIDSAMPSKIIVMNLIITPEYIQRMKKDHPDVIIYALRLDRGMSEKSILSTELGQYIEQEKGLDKHDYIIPGAGGVGEILNNSYV